MKSSEIINHILENPLYKNLKSSKECKDFLNLLGKNRVNLIKFAYIKEATLFIAVSHPLALQELKNDNIISQIKTLLKSYINFNPKTSLKPCNDVKFFVTKIVKFKKASPTPSKIMIEKSNGEFVNLAQNSEIYTLFENLRIAIKKAKNAS
ncbi:hypothetical protein CIG1485E_1291 [Campylobacter iguaniorum]|uniref:Uncharacterized protein n=1 Tax=Campylobacter iguaniorum TaxID=1244531 RepID=A0A076FH25_9BACT|nr:hypothetical protein [Campylobacter iguaniorum]AII15124.1 hypothetical protein CIG1485E_1291 [Campylobacter iguaniorum]